MAEAETGLQREDGQLSGQSSTEVELHTPPPSLADGPNMPEDSTVEGLANQPKASQGGRTHKPVGLSVRPAQKRTQPGVHAPGDLACDGVPNKPKLLQGHPRKRTSEEDLHQLLQPPLEFEKMVPQLPDSEIGRRNGPANVRRTVPITQHRKQMNIPSEPGFEDMMHDLSSLIDELPLGGSSGGSPLRRLAQLPTALVGPLASYDPSGRPTSRWRGQYRFTQRGHSADVEDTLARLHQQHPGLQCTDLRNPYIRALQQTRKALEKSADLTFESSPAMLLATERENALAGMQVFEAEEICQPQRNKLSCMPEPCVENFVAACRQQEIWTSDSDLGLDAKLQGGPSGLDANLLVESHSLGHSHIVGATPRPSTRSSVQEFLREADIWRASDREGSLSSRDVPSSWRKTF